MAYRFVIALSRSPPRDNSRPGVQAKDIIWRDCSKKKNLSIAVPAKFIQIVDSFTGLRRRRGGGVGGGGRAYCRFESSSMRLRILAFQIQLR